MSTLQEKAQCISWFIETKSDINDLQHQIIIEAIDTVTANMLART